MKKCASCTKDLPDAALHCVFCGAKQAPASSQPAPARTVMGYQASDVAEHVRQQGAQPPSRSPGGPAPSNLPAATPHNVGGVRPPPSQPPPSAPAHVGPPPNYAAPAPRPAAFQPPPAAAPMNPSGAANAATLLAPGGGAALVAPPGAGYPAPPPGYAPSPSQPAPMMAAPLAPVKPIPVAPIPSATPPYLASQTAARSGRPIEPWKDSLRLMMFIWGGLLLAAFATPTSLDPLLFNWDAILNAAGTDKLPPLIMAAVGLLSIVVAAIPMTPAPRGMIAALLGMAGIFVPVLLHGMPPWQMLVSTIGILIVVPSLLVRHEYRDAALPRIMITVGAIGALLPLVLPDHDAVPLVELFKLAIDAPGSSKIIVILMLGQVALLVLSLLSWLPSPASGAAKPIAWLLMLWPLIMFAAMLFLVGDPDMVTKRPFSGAMSWLVAGATGLGGGNGLAMIMAGAGIGVAYFAIIGYGGATVLGKNLE